MKSSGSNLVYIDDGIKSMHEFIVDCKKQPIKPDACNGAAYSNAKLGELGEQYVRCLFKEAGVRKLPKRQRPSPDFQLYINGKPFVLEAKTVSNLYRNPLELLSEIKKEERHNKGFLNKFNAILKDYRTRISPFDVRREDQKKYKEQLRNIIEKIELPLDSEVKFQIKCEKKTYILSIGPLKRKIKGIHSFFIGWVPDETMTLRNIIKKKKEQIGSCDILVIILLNRTIDEVDLLDFFYRSIGLSLDLEPSESESLMQYQYSQTIWGAEFKDRQSQLHTIDERLKCVIVIYPHSKASLIFPSIKYFENFGCPEYTYLRLLLEAKQLKCYLASHEVQLRRLRNLNERPS